MVFPTFFRGVCRSAALLWLLLVAAVSARAQVAQPTWQSAVIDTVITARDGAGNVYTTGKFRNTVTFGSTTLTSAGGTDVFVTKQNASGGYEWAVRAGGDQDDTGTQLFVDATGSLVTVGGRVTSDTADFGGQHLISTMPGDPAQSFDFFVGKLSAAGQWQWVEAVCFTRGSICDAAISKVAMDGSVYVWGHQADGADFSGRFYSDWQNNGAPQSFFAKLSPTGFWQWMNDTYAASAAWIEGAVYDDNDNAYVVGWYDCSFSDFNFGTDTTFATFPGLNGPGMNRVFVAKVMPEGRVAWGAATDVNTTTNAEGTGIALDGLGHILISGNFSGTATFGTTTLTGTGANEGFVANLTTSGAWQWAVRSSSGADISANLALDAVGNIYLGGSFAGLTATFGATTLTNSDATGRTRDLFVARLSPLGAVQWAISAGGPGQEYAAISGVDAWGVATIGGSFEGSTATFGSTTLSNPYSANPIPNNRLPFSARLLPSDGARLGGRLFVDANGNGARDSGEGPTPQPVVVEVQPGPFYVSPNASGGFGAAVLPGNYTLTLPNPPLYYTATPATHAASFTAVGQVDTTNHFGLRPTQSSNDLRVSLTASGALRAGRPVRYVVTCANVGTTVQPAVTAALTLDPRITYQSSTPATVAGQTLTWAVGPLAPFERRTLVITGQLSTTLQRGDSVVSTATLTSPLTDLTPADNAVTSREFVIGSYDPNDKQVSARRLTPPQAAAGSWLTYTIRFQNTGNDTAFDVRILDTLRAQVQRGTVEVLAASHPLTWQLRGEGIFDFRFANILLPDSARDEPASHGFVQYRVRVQPTLVVGDSVANAADIYFDYNAPVRTNTALTRVQWPLGVGAAGVRLPLSLSPNPASGWVRLTVASAVAGPLDVRVFNALGQVVWQEQTRVGAGQVSRRLPVAGWAAGVYQVQVRSGAQATTQRLVVQP